MKNKILKIFIVILIYVMISLGVFGLLYLFGLTSVNKIQNLIGRLGVCGYIIFFIFQIVVSTFICVIPFEDELLVGIAIVLFGPIKGFIIASVNMLITSTLQFIIGRYFFKGLLAKFLGGEAIVKYQKYLSVKGELMLPILYAIPLFPHDSLCILSGMSKMKIWYFIPITLVMRSIEIASLCFLGSGIIDFASLTVFDWIVLANILIVDIYLILKLHHYVDKRFNG